MNHINDLHEQAMDFADRAFIARRQGDTELADKLSRQAFELERSAAQLLRDDTSSEPTRSVLYRSAASMAIDFGDSRAAERLIATALMGNPPREIADELLGLLEQANFIRHLALRGINLMPGELQFSLAGNVVGYGIALSEVFIERIKDLERLIYRTVERKLGVKFRERGAAKQVIQQGYSLYIAAPRPASFAVTLRLGRQMQLPGFDLSIEIVDEILECFSLFNTAQDEELKKRIADEPYYHNFIGLAKRIAPDGDKVNLVGFTTLKDGQETKLALTRRQREISLIPEQVTTEQAEKFVKVTGRLLFADATRKKRKIQLIDEAETAYTIIVPEGMMNDIVRPLWDDIVVVTGTRSKNKIHLIEISRVPE